MQGICYKPNDIALRVKGVTNLSYEEYMECKDIIPVAEEYHDEFDDAIIDGAWWLRSATPGTKHKAAQVDPDGQVYDGWVSVECGVRPVLLYEAGSDTLSVGDRVHIGNHDFTVIQGNRMLCDEMVENMFFNRDAEGEHANDYDYSDLRVWTEEWGKRTFPELNVVEQAKERSNMSLRNRVESARRDSVEQTEKNTENPQKISENQERE